ncbi:Demethylmenaquinone methyltransferase [Thalassovita gelatinovora]|uniref:Demethylmenaquinone methyltransferase n=1 Tax=Thalassovita gelatinovora TaxID=53501 RepID=A0A0P1FC67_THAGE|nr:class I SAM-dependent methyltransferase [Thalassovita gelatinovora]QIZ80422.1 class I SAM-dependent methyltransferase [Thalassovita gelatinovora]CUH65804.1 Demethylmenaquinone methyltransferase [Thalassovita gelatinovora]SEQ72106.1 Ubiquinone/menaquinone biosynthesis C-methylase UbiE [Thalassovita gelatinovora]
MQSAAKFWDKMAHRYAETPIRDMDSYEYTLERTRSYLKQSDRVLELGCGTGTTAVNLAGSAGVVVASDLAAEMVQIGKTRAAEANADNVYFVQADVDDAELREDPYDVVMAFNLLHLIEDIDVALAHIRDMVKPGGVFISKTVCLAESGGSLKLRAIKLALPLMQLLGKAPFVRFFSIGALERAFEKAGFEIIESGNFPARPPSRYLVVRRK